MLAATEAPACRCPACVTAPWAVPTVRTRARPSAAATAIGSTPEATPSSPAPPRAPAVSGASWPAGPGHSRSAAMAATWPSATTSVSLTSPGRRIPTGGPAQTALGVCGESPGVTVTWIVWTEVTRTVVPLLTSSPLVGLEWSALEDSSSRTWSTCWPSISPTTSR